MAIVAEEQDGERVHACYLRRMYRGGDARWPGGCWRCGMPPGRQSRSVEKIIREMEEQQGIAYAPQQRQAVALAAAHAGVLLS